MGNFGQWVKNHKAETEIFRESIQELKHMGKWREYHQAMLKTNELPSNLKYST